MEYRCLGRPVDLGLDPELLQLGARLGGDLFDQGRALTAARIDQARDLAIRPGVQRLEREVLELPLQLLDTEAVRERRVDLQGLGGDAPLLGFGEHAERAHVVQAVGELDQQHADVAGHRHEHLAEVLGLLLLSRAELEPVELREAVDDARDLLAELLLDRRERDVRVLHGVVEQRGLEGGGVQAQVRQDRGDRHGMFDEVLARLALLPLVRVLGEHERPLDLLQVGLRVVGANLLQDRVDEARGPGVTAAQARARDVRQASTPPRLSRRRRCLLLVEGDLFPAVHVLPPVWPVYGDEAGGAGRSGRGVST